MARHSKNTSNAKAVRRAQKQAARAAKRSGGDKGALSAAPSTHIKGHTRGTSNEISFSVLHARRAAANAAPEGKKTHGVAATPKTMAEVAAEEARNEAAAALGATDDAARRPKRRVWQVAAVIAGCAAAAALAVFAVLHGMNAEQQRHDQLTEAIGLIEEADTTLFAFDGVVVSAMQGTLPEMAADGVALRYEECAPELDSAEEKLARARQLVEAAQPNLTDADDKRAANEVLATLNAREALIDSGKAAMDETVVVIDLYQQVESGWTGLLDADALARDAAALSGYATTATLEAALAKTGEAVDAFATVRSAFSRAKEDVAEQLTYQADLNDGQLPAVPEGSAPDDSAVGALQALDAVLQVYLDYVNLRIDAQYEAERSTQALIDHDAALATEANDAYNLLDSRAVNLIRGAEDQPLAHVTALFELEREGLFRPYEQARLRASQSDAYLSEYLEK